MHGESVQPRSGPGWWRFRPGAIGLHSPIFLRAQTPEEATIPTSEALCGVAKDPTAAAARAGGHLHSVFLKTRKAGRGSDLAASVAQTIFIGR